MKFKEILARLTGFSVPVFGVSWNPPEPEVQKARRVITQLEDRRVLCNASELEVPAHCVQSVIEIRRMLSAELETLDATSELTASEISANEPPMIPPASLTTARAKLTASPNEAARMASR